MLIEKAYNLDPTLIDIPTKIITNRLFIRAFEEGDEEVLLKAIEETWDDIEKWFSNNSLKTKDIELNVENQKQKVLKAIENFKQRANLQFLVFDKNKEFIIGYVNLREPNWRIRRFTLGYWIVKSQQGKGYATEVGNALTRYAFEKLNARVVTAGYAEGNVGSKRVIEKLGFDYALKKPYDYELSDGTLIDGHGYHITDCNKLPKLEVYFK